MLFCRPAVQQSPFANQQKLSSIIAERYGHLRQYVRFLLQCLSAHTDRAVTYLAFRLDWSQQIRWWVFAPVLHGGTLTEHVAVTELTREYASDR